MHTYAENSYITQWQIQKTIIIGRGVFGLIIIHKVTLTHLFAAGARITVR